MVVMCAKEKFYQDLVAIMGAPQLAEDHRFNTFADRLENRDALGPLLKALSCKKTTTEWLGLLRGRVPCGPVNTVAEALSDPQTAEDAMVLEMDHPDLGTVRLLASPIKVDGEPATHRLGPRIGEHTEQVLRRYAGASEEEIRSWRREGVL